MRGLSVSSFDPKVEVKEEGRGVEAEDQLWESRLRPKKGAKASILWEPQLAKGECDKLAHKWLALGNDPTKRRKDHSATDVLKWWKDSELGHAEIADLARRWLCAQASSATSECAFSKADLIVSKKRQRLMANHVDGISLMGWHYKDNGWGEIARDPGVGQKWKEISIEICRWVGSCGEMKWTCKWHALWYEPCGHCTCVISLKIYMLSAGIVL